MSGRDIQFQRLADFVPTKINWLWFPYIAYGKITLLQGDPGEGKSTVAIDIASRLSRGSAMPDGSSVPESQTILYLCQEDGIGDTIIPRFIKCGANCDKVGCLVGDEITLQDQELADVVCQHGVKLLIVDPIQDYWAQELDMQRASSVRKQMRQIAALAAKTKCAVILIGHLNKRESANNLHRGLGSVDIVAAARSVLQISRLESQPTIRVLSQIKNNLAPAGDDYAFELDPELGLQWIGPIDIISEGDALAEAVRNARHNKQETAAQSLLEWLSDHDLSANEIESRLNAMGITYRTAKYIKQDLGIRSVKKADGWYWHLGEEAIQSKEQE